jgi:hypothetical protein
MSGEDWGETESADEPDEFPIESPIGPQRPQVRWSVADLIAETARRRRFVTPEQDETRTWFRDGPGS